jgi:hypothetical protein
MSIGSLGAIGAFAATTTSQRASDVDKTQHEVSEQSRTQDAIETAEQAAGIGETHEESQAGDRDADGRRLWESSEQKVSDKALAPTMEPPPAKDPTGTAGNLLDLTG